MDKNFFIAFLISTVVIFGYYTMYPPPQAEAPEETKKVVEEPVNSEAVSKALAPVIGEDRGSTAPAPVA